MVRCGKIGHSGGGAACWHPPKPITPIPTSPDATTVKPRSVIRKFPQQYIAICNLSGDRGVLLSFAAIYAMRSFKAQGYALVTFSTLFPEDDDNGAWIRLPSGLTLQVPRRPDDELMALLSQIENRDLRHHRGIAAALRLLAKTSSARRITDGAAQVIDPASQTAKASDYLEGQPPAGIAAIQATKPYLDERAHAMNVANMQDEDALNRREAGFATLHNPATGDAVTVRAPAAISQKGTDQGPLYNYTPNYTDRDFDTMAGLIKRGYVDVALEHLHVLGTPSMEGRASDGKSVFVLKGPRGPLKQSATMPDGTVRDVFVPAGSDEPSQADIDQVANIQAGLRARSGVPNATVTGIVETDDHRTFYIPGPH